MDAPAVEDAAEPRTLPEVEPVATPAARGLDEYGRLAAEEARAARLRAVRERHAAANGSDAAAAAAAAAENAGRAAPLADLLAAREVVNQAARETFLPAPPVRVPTTRKRRDGRFAWLIAAALVAALLAVGIWYAVAQRGGQPGSANNGQQRPGPVGVPTKSVTPTTPRPTTPSAPASSTASGGGTKTSSSPPASTTRPSANPLTPGAMTTFIQDYYALAVQNPNESWKRIGPGEIQDRGKGRYLSFWRGVRSVRVTDLHADPAARTVTATITFTDAGGTHPAEHHVLSVIPTRDGTGLLITHDRIG